MNDASSSQAKKPSANKRKGPELIAELADLAARELEDVGLSPDQARDVGVRIADAFATSFGGILAYIPQNTAKRIAERDEEISRELGTIDAQTLALKHGLCVQQIYRAARRAKARRTGGGARR